MFTIYGDRQSFYQWDSNQKLIVNSPICSEVHFSNVLSTEALVCKSYELDGLTVVDVPNILLTEALDIKAYIVAEDGQGCRTCNTGIFEVVKRDKPADYVYIETYTTKAAGINSKDGGALFNDYESNKALGVEAAAFGSNNIAGCKGYYIKSIDFSNKKIYLSNEEVTPVFSAIDNTDTTFSTPAYEVGDTLSIVAQSYNHWIECSSIASIKNNVITYNDDLPFQANSNTSYVYVLKVAKKALVGAVTVALNAFVAGKNNIAAAECAHVEGYNNLVAGNYGHAEGRNNIAAYGAHVENVYNKALGNYSHAEGCETEALAAYSHAEGKLTVASGVGAHTEGQNTVASGELSHAEGKGTKATAIGAHAEGSYSEANGYYSHAEGERAIAQGNYSHAEGNSTIASKDCAHAEGRQSKADGMAAHAEGYSTQALSNYSHTEGRSCYARGECAHAEGYFCEANGYYSHAEGEGTICNSHYAHTQGKYNVIDNEQKYAHIVGNGTSNTTRSNAYTLDWKGNSWQKGSIEAAAIILTSPNGTRYKLTVADDGTLKTVAA